MDFERLQKNIKELCDESNLILNDKLEDDSYVASIMDSDENKNNVLNISAGENRIDSYVVTSDGNEVEKFSSDRDINDNEGLEFVMDSIDSFKILSGIDPDETDEEGNSILNEDEDASTEFSGIVDGLNKIKLDQKKIADKLRDLSKLSDDPEVIAIVMDLSNNSYSAVLDMEAAIDSYNEIMEIPDEDISDEESQEIDESVSKITEARSRIDIAKSLIAMRTLNKLNLVTDDNLKAFESLTESLFR